MMRLVVALVVVASAMADSPNGACPPLTARSPPSDVKALKPVDVKVVAAMGDSFTAGFAIHGTPHESRDESWACGTKENATTMVNFFRRYNSNVASHNMAVSGDVVQGMDKQARRVIAAIKADSTIDFEKDWKMVNILIGGNNQCPACLGKEANKPQMYKEDLTSALEILSKGLPRSVVNIVPMSNLSSLATAPGTKTHCERQHIIGRIECPCPFLGAAATEAVENTTEADNALMYDIAKSFVSSDFAVVVQPALDMMSVPDWTYLSRFDCFHPSLKTHQQTALGLWMNLFQPLGKKTDDFSKILPVSLYCPTDDDMIFTSPTTAIV